MTSMLTTGEQQELCQIEQDLRDAAPGFARRLALLQGMLRWAAPGRRVYLLVLAVLTAAAVLAAALVRLVAAAGRLLMAFAEGAMFMEPAALMAFGDTARPGREPGQTYSASPAQDRLQADGADLR